jgi:hypothetical protein
MTVYNINDNVKFRLTEYGKSVLYENDRASFYKPDDDGYYDMQIWVVMQIFGEKMYVGNNEIFIENKIDIRGEFDKAFEMANKFYRNGNISFDLECSKHAC